MALSEGMELYGVGALFVVGADGTPRKLAKLQDVNMDMSFTNKPLFGEKNVASLIPRGHGKITGKATIAKFSADVLNQVFFNQVATAGQVLLVDGEEHTITAAAAVATNTATFTTDLGLVNKATGKQFLKVAATPAVGEYTCDAVGNYAFNATDNGVVFRSSYLHTSTTGGKTIAIKSEDTGTIVTFMGVFSKKFNGKTETVILNKLTSSKLSLLSMKQEDYSMPNFDFEAMADDNDNIGTISIGN